MPSTTAELGTVEAERQRAELHAVLQSDLFVRSPTLANLLSYLCEKMLTGEGDQIKEYSLAVDVFRRPETFDQDADSIVRVQVNRLRKRLAEFYSGEGSGHRLHISIPVGHYVPVFQEATEDTAPANAAQGATEAEPSSLPPLPLARKMWLLLGPIGLLLLLLGVAFLARLLATPWRSKIYTSTRALLIWRWSTCSLAMQVSSSVWQNHPLLLIC